MPLHRLQTERLTRLFASLLGPLTIGCAANEGVDLSQFSENLCNDGYQILDAVEPSQSVDFLELRQSSTWDHGTGEPEWSSPVVLDSSGQPCAGASDAPACQQALAALGPQSEFNHTGFEGDTYHQIVAYSRADDVGALRSRAELLTFLGPLDTTGDAALVAALEGHQLVCTENDDVGMQGDDYLVHIRTGGGCGEGDHIREHVLVVHPDGSVEVTQSVIVERGDPNCAVGRLPAGLCRRPLHRTHNPVGSFFADVAHLEAAAVVAFEQLTSELVVHGAPLSLVASARLARQEEVRHARRMAGVARRHGGRPRAPRVSGWRPRSLTDVAIDNAAEGCVRETFGALVAHIQARRATDPRVRRVLAEIAVDETRHAALSWDLAHWTRARLRPTERRRAARGAREAVERLQTELTGEHDPSVCATAGMPTPDEARDIFVRLRDELLA